MYAPNGTLARDARSNRVTAGVTRSGDAGGGGFGYHRGGSFLVFRVFTAAMEDCPSSHVVLVRWSLLSIKAWPVLVKCSWVSSCHVPLQL